MKRTRLSLVLSALLLSGCGGPSAYNRVFKRTAQHINSQTYAADHEVCWNAVNRATLALNFSVDQQDKARGLLQASRYYTEGKRTTTITVQANVQVQGQQRTTVYLNAVQRTERLFARSHTRFFLWVIPLPGGGGTEANRVKEAERTVDDKQFYQAFFRTIEQELHAAQSSEQPSKVENPIQAGTP